MVTIICLKDLHKRALSCMSPHVNLKRTLLCKTLAALIALKWFQTDVCGLMPIPISFGGKFSVTLPTAVSHVWILM